MKTYNHAFTIAFSVDSEHADELDVLQKDSDKVIDALLARVSDVIKNNELAEACEGYDVYENEGSVLTQEADEDE